MKLWWGNYPFGDNAAQVTNQTVAEISPFGLPLRYVSAYSVVAVLDGTSQSDLSNKEAALRAALAVPKQDFVLKTDAGKASSAVVYSKDTLSGTRVRNVEFKEAAGGEFVNRRTVSFTIDAVYLIANAANAVIMWKETVQIIGNGGPRRVWRYPTVGPGIRQTLSQYSAVIATQTGQAIGHTRRPTRPLPIWPGYLHNETDGRGNDSPDFLGQAWVNWPVTWSYRFERGDGPLVGFAGNPPGTL